MLGGLFQSWRAAASHHHNGPQHTDQHNQHGAGQHASQRRPGHRQPAAGHRACSGGQSGSERVQGTTAGHRACSRVTPGENGFRVLSAGPRACSKVQSGSRAPAPAHRACSGGHTGPAFTSWGSGKALTSSAFPRHFIPQCKQNQATKKNIREGRSNERDVSHKSLLEPGCPGSIGAD